VYDDLIIDRFTGIDNPPTPSRSRPWQLHGVLALAVVLAVPLVVGVARTPRLSVSPASGLVGSTVFISGSGFNGSRGQITFDGTAVGMPAFVPDSSGSFALSVKVPAATLGAHTFAAVSTKNRDNGKALASAAFTVTTTPTITPSPAPKAAPTPDPKPTVASTPTATPYGKSVTVNTIPTLLTALADNTIDAIVVRNGTYLVDPASAQRANSLWIGSRFASRTRPILVRAETIGGVMFDGGGSTSFGGLTFVDGAHDQTWDGFNFANGQATSTGVIVFGGYAGRAAPHHITLRNIKVLASCTGRNDRSDHAVYFSYAVGGPHDILIDGLTVDGTGPSPLSSALHFYHSDSTNQNAWNTTIRRLVVSGTYTAIFLWDSTLHDVTIDGATITNAHHGAVRYEQPGQRITLANMTSTGSGKFGFYSSAGDPPPGVTFINNSFR